MENSNWLYFCKKRIIRVLIPYVIWTIIYSIFYKYSLKNFIFCLFSTKASPILYYIFVYIQLVLITPILSKILKYNLHWFLLFVTPFFIIIYKYLPLFFNYEYSFLFNCIFSISFFSWFIFYYFGLLFGNNIIRINKNFYLYVFLFIFSIILQILESFLWLKFANSNDCGTQLKFSSIIFSILFCCLCIMFLKNDKFKINNFFLIYIGDISFEIYLSHYLIRDIIRQFYHFIIPIEILLVFLISILFCYTFNKFFGNKISKFFGII